MHKLSIIVQALLAGQCALAAYIPIPSILARHNGEDDSAAVTVTHIVSLTTYLKPSSFKSDPTSTLTRTRTLFTTVYESAAPSASHKPGVNPINGLQAPSASPKNKTSSTTSYETAPSWVRPSAFRTKPWPTWPNVSTSSTEAYSTTQIAGITIVPLTLTTISGKKTFVPIPLSEELTSTKTPMSTTLTTEKSKTTSFAFQSPTSDEDKSSSSESSSSSSEEATPTSSKAFEFPYPTESRSSKTFKFPYPTEESTTKSFEFPYPTKESKTSSAEKPKETEKDRCAAFPYPDCP